jgi:hypothetical protein
MRATIPISALIFGILFMSMLFVTCNNTNIGPSPIEDLRTLQFIEDENELQITTLDNNLVLTFNKEDFNEDLSEFNIRNTVSIKKLPFKCQKDEFFSNNIWIVEPDDIKFDRELIITIKYTHEEFAPEFNTSDLKIYKLRRDFHNRESYDKEQLLIRVSDMSLLDHCIQNNELMSVSTKISGFGAFVLGREVQ